MRPTTVFIDVETHEQIIREMNDEEYTQHLIDVASANLAAEKQAEEEAIAEAKKEAKKQALAALGLSQEIVNLLAE
jgi:hypothetical protein